MRGDLLKWFYLMCSVGVYREALDAESPNVVFIFIVLFPFGCIFMKANASQLYWVGRIVFKDNLISLRVVAFCAAA